MMASVYGLFRSAVLTFDEHQRGGVEASHFMMGTSIWILLPCLRWKNVETHYNQ